MTTKRKEEKRVVLGELDFRYEVQRFVNQPVTEKEYLSKPQIYQGRIPKELRGKKIRLIAEIIEPVGKGKK